MKEKFVSIRTKLITNTMLIISVIFILVLSVITFMNVQSVNRGIKKSEHNIRNSLIAGGNTLANNNAMAMRGMAEDNAFTAIQTLVSSTVKDDPDIEYGIYMDDSRIPWVNASSENPSGIVRVPAPLTGPISKWAASLRSLSYQTITYGNRELIEFAAPVVVYDEILGVIRYGFSTWSMNHALREAYENGIQARNQAVTVLLLLGVLSLAVTYLIIRRIAAAITRPIGSLVQSANTISQGNYNIEISSESNDEIGNLAEHFETMRVTIKQYTDHLQDMVDEKMQQVNDILNNIDQGLFTINLYGSVNKEYSARANDVLKVKDVAAASLNEILRMDSKQERAFHIWMDLIRKRHGKQRWAKLTRLAPVRELEISNSHDISDYISIEYQKIHDKECKLSKIMILARDETEKRIKELQMEEQRRKHKNEMNLILGLVNTPPTEISEFMEDTCERMKRTGQLTEEYLSGVRKHRAAYPDGPDYDISDEQINVLYRDIHTIKGNSGSYGFENLSEHAHQSENMLEKLREPVDIRRDDILKQMMEHLDCMNEDIDEIQQKIKLIFGRDEDAGMRVPRSHVKSITETCAAIDRDSLSPEVRRLIDKCIMLSWVPIETITRKYQKIVSRVARRCRKNIIYVAKPEHAFYPPDIFSDIDDALTHLVRNAADHGIEPPEVREELGKGIGQVIFEFLDQNKTRTIRISDDGKGIDTEKLTEICIRKGVITREDAESFSETEKLNLVFAPGISTCDKVTDISGRGIGMDVVREKIENIRGTISIDSGTEIGTIFTLVLPRHANQKHLISDHYHVLDELKNSLALSAAECSMSLFGIKPELREPWSLTDQISGSYDHVLSVRSANTQFQGITVVGIQTEHIKAFIDEYDSENDIEIATDALGEFANIYTAMIMDELKFRDSFGVLRSSPPSYARNQVVFPRVWGINGRLFADNHWMYVGFTIENRDQESGL